MVTNRLVAAIIIGIMNLVRYYFKIELPVDDGTVNMIVGVVMSALTLFHPVPGAKEKLPTQLEPEDVPVYTGGEAPTSPKATDDA